MHLEELENAINIEPRRGVEDYIVNQKLRIVAPKVMEHDKELLNMRLSLG